MEKKVQKRRFRGTVVSTGMNKTALVEVTRGILHQKYKKRYKKSRRFKVHDPKEEAKVGDIVEFTECRPLSRNKRWRIVKPKQ